jgi:hypothetical protein
MNRSFPRFGAILGAGLVVALSGAPASAQVRIAAEAAAGSPLGVGRVVLLLPENQTPEPLGFDGLGLSEKQGRALYPATHSGRLAGLARNLLDDTPLLTGGPVRQEIRGILREVLGQAPRTTIYFLFHGDGPLELSVHGRRTHAVTVQPRGDARLHQKLLADWWDAYTARPGLLEQKPDYPPVVENYLRATLARRLNLRLPLREQTDSPKDMLAHEVGLLLESESLRLALGQNRLLMLHELGQPSDQPLGEPPPAAALDLPEPPADVAVEPIALRVPEECFYVRFGSFANFLWVQDTLARFRGDLGNLVAARGLDHGLAGRIERQLVLKTTEMSRLLGPAVVADAALVGTDTFFYEGAAFGVLLQARSNTALSADILRQRLERKLAGGVEETTLKIAGRDVAYLASPDGRVRSYYATSGDYHFVTTSRALVERFLEVASSEGAGSLGRGAEFRHARSLLPLERKDTVWAFFGDAFFRNLSSPRYRTEMIRRLQAAVDVELVELARLAAAAEGKPSGSIEELIAGALLPPDFGPRPDRSEAVLDGGEVYDRLRGRRGAFVPVPDVPLESVTQAEAAEYRRFAEFYAREWGHMDPTVVALRREAMPGRRERVTLDVRLSPLAAKHFEILSQWAGPPSSRRVAPIEGDAARIELAMPDQYVFAGLRDVRPPLELAGSSGAIWSRPRDWLVGYVGTTGELGILSLLASPLVFPPGIAGELSIQVLAERRQAGEFTVFSLHPEMLAQVAPQLKFVETERAAQLRAEVADLSEAGVAPWINQWGYRRSRETTLGNLRLLHAVREQLRVPPETALAAAESLLDAKLVCPLGGQYAYRPERPGGWTSVALENDPSSPLRGPTAPPGYVAPPLDWFRGLSLEATMTRATLTLHAEVVMQLPAGK